MGEFLGYRCNYCGYEEARIPVGKGREEGLELKLFLCPSCKSVHSTWVRNGETPRCSLCYDRDIQMLEPITQKIICPKCGTDAVVTEEPGTWE